MSQRKRFFYLISVYGIDELQKFGGLRSEPTFGELAERLDVLIGDPTPHTIELFYNGQIARPESLPSEMGISGNSEEDIIDAIIQLKELNGSTQYSQGFHDKSTSLSYSQSSLKMSIPQPIGKKLLSKESNSKQKQNESVGLFLPAPLGCKEDPKPFHIPAPVGVSKQSHPAPPIPKPPPKTYNKSAEEMSEQKEAKAPGKTKSHAPKSYCPKKIKASIGDDYDPEFGRSSDFELDTPKIKLSKPPPLIEEDIPKEKPRSRSKSTPLVDDGDGPRPLMRKASIQPQTQEYKTLKSWLQEFHFYPKFRGQISRLLRDSNNSPEAALNIAVQELRSQISETDLALIDLYKSKYKFNDAGIIRHWMGNGEDPDAFKEYMHIPKDTLKQIASETSKLSMQLGKGIRLYLSLGKDMKKFIKEITK